MSDVKKCNNKLTPKRKENKVLRFYYYSSGNTTDRFVKRYLLPACHELKVAAQARRVYAESPHKEAVAFSLGMKPVDRSEARRTANLLSTERSVMTRHLEGFAYNWSKDKTVVIIPSYGRFNHEKHVSEDYIPRCLQGILANHAKDPNLYVILTGNRTFGGKFLAAKEDLPAGARVAGEIELDGSYEEALEIVRWLTEQPLETYKKDDKPLQLLVDGKPVN